MAWRRPPLAILLLAAVALCAVGAVGIDLVSYRAAVLETADAAAPVCFDPRVRALLIARFKRQPVPAARNPHVFLSTRLTPLGPGVAFGAARRALRAAAGPRLVTPAQAAGAYCAVGDVKGL